MNIEQSTMQFPSGEWKSWMSWFEGGGAEGGCCRLSTAGQWRWWTIIITSITILIIRLWIFIRNSFLIIHIGTWMNYSKVEATTDFHSIVNLRTDRNWWKANFSFYFFYSFYHFCWLFCSVSRSIWLGNTQHPATNSRWTRIQLRPMINSSMGLSHVCAIGTDAFQRSTGHHFRQYVILHLIEILKSA